ncbi:unnamed protein product, partial [marine sediment metagenome]
MARQVFRFGKKQGLLKKILCAALFFLNIMAFNAWTQFLADPNDQIYRFLSLWEQKGYIKFLPPLRPYPLQLVKHALLEVQEKGSELEAGLAGRFLMDFQGSILPVPFKLLVSQDNQLKGRDYQARIGLELLSTGAATERIAYSLGGRLRFDKYAEGEVYPRWTDEYEKTIPDEAKPAGQAEFTVGNTTFNSYGVLTGAFFLGTERFYAQAGLMRSSFGPMIESPVLGPQSPQAGHFSITYRSDWFTLSSVFLELVAKYGVNPNGEIYSLKSVSANSYPGKHLIIHSANIHPFDWLNIGLFQTILFGARLSPVYFFPFPLYTQAYIGDWDNSLIGGSVQLALPLNVQYNFLLYVDDLNAQELTKLNFDSNHNKVALQTGISWIAPLNLPNRISLSYLMITPYMYTHSSHQAINYLQYTHQGKHLGSVLEPNSDQWSFSVFFMPLRWIQLEAWAKRIRHGNGSDYADGEGSVDGDGSIFDDGYLPDGTVTFRRPSSFLKQETLEKVLQLGLTL